MIMNTKVAIVRGINVGGKRKILMADLKSLCMDLGLRHITTYIQSGNLIFDSEKTSPELEALLEGAIEEHFGFAVPVIVRNATELRDSVKSNPFYDKDIDIRQLHLTFLKEKPTQKCIERLLSDDYSPEKLHLNQKDIFILCSGKYHQSKLTNNFFEKKLQIEATTRNWKTVLKLSELSNT